MACSATINIPKMRCRVGRHQSILLPQRNSIFGSSLAVNLNGQVKYNRIVASPYEFYNLGLSFNVVNHDSRTGW
jgi:hypothetical protein